MNRYLFIGLLCAAFQNNTSAQATVDNFSVGTNYADATYYTLSDGATSSIKHSDWDIAFGVDGATNAAIFVNEGAAYMGSPTKIYSVPSKSFSDVITSSDFGAELLNDEQSWTSGALNSVKGASVLDYGWGTYNMTNHQVVGDHLYAVELSGGTQLKLSIDSMANGIYYFKYANLDGTNQQVQSLNKSTHTGENLAYFSFTTKSFKTNVEPASWDLLFTRYKTVVSMGGTTTPYTVGGTLTNAGVKVAKATGINPATVTSAAYPVSEDSLTAIGHDWKSYSFSSGWSVATDRVYFVQSVDNILWKVQFIDFKGSSTGNGTLQKTNLGTISSVENVTEDNQVQTFDVYPNPASDVLNIAYTVQNQAEKNIQLQLVNMYGQVLLSKSISVEEGLNAVVLNTTSFPAGNYVVVLQGTQERLVKKVILN